MRWGWNLRRNAHRLGAAGKSLLLLKNNADDSKDKLVWKWLKGAATTIGELGDPTGATDYTLCLYSGTGAAAIALPAGSNWQTLGTTGFKFETRRHTERSAEGTREERFCRQDESAREG